MAFIGVQPVSTAATVTGATQSAITAVGTLTSLVATTADINAGTVDATIGGTTPAAGTFTTLTSTSEVSTKTAPSISTNVLALDMSASSFFATSLDANITSFTVTNIPASGKLGIIVLELTADGTARTITWTFNNIADADKTVDWPGATAPTLSEANGDRDTFVFFTYDGGETWSGSTFGQAV